MAEEGLAPEEETKGASRLSRKVGEMTEGALGGAEAPSREQGGTGMVAVSLREKIQDILSSNLMQVLLLRKVGAMLFQCMKTCCKPMPMVDEDLSRTLLEDSW